MAKTNKKSVVGVGLGTAGLGSFELGNRAGKEAAGFSAKSARSSELAGIYENRANVRNDMVRWAHSKGYKDTADRIGKEVVAETGEANFHRVHANFLKQKAGNLTGKSKVLRGVGIAGMALGAGLAGLGMVQETKASYQEARDRKKAIRDARK